MNYNLNIFFIFFELIIYIILLIVMLVFVILVVRIWNKELKGIYILYSVK